MVPRFRGLVAKKKVANPKKEGECTLPVSLGEVPTELLGDTKRDPGQGAQITWQNLTLMLQDLCGIYSALPAVLNPHLGQFLQEYSRHEAL